MCLPGNRERDPPETTANVLGRHAGLPLQANDERQQFQAHGVRLNLKGEKAFRFHLSDFTFQISPLKIAGIRLDATAFSS